MVAMHHVQSVNVGTTTPEELKVHASFDLCSTAALHLVQGVNASSLTVTPE